MIKIEHDANGIIFREEYDENGLLINRTSYAPTTALSDLPIDIVEHAKMAWTSEVIATYQALLENPFNLTEREKLIAKIQQKDAEITQRNMLDYIDGDAFAVEKVNRVRSELKVLRKELLSHAK